MTMGLADSRLAEDVVWHPATTTRNGVGDTTTTAADPVTLRAVVGARTGNLGELEAVDDSGPEVVITRTLYLLDTLNEPGASDEFTVRGQRYRVIGPSMRWANRGVQVEVRRTEKRP